MIRHTANKKQAKYMRSVSLAALAALFVAMPLPVLSASVQSRSASKPSMHHGRERAGISMLNANANFRRVEPIAINYRIRANLAQTPHHKIDANSAPHFAQVSVRTASNGNPITLNCSIQPNYEEGGAETEAHARPCMDIGALGSQQLLSGGEQYIRRIPLAKKANAKEAMRSGETLVLSFSYL